MADKMCSISLLTAGMNNTAISIVAAKEIRVDYYLDDSQLFYLAHEAIRILKMRADGRTMTLGSMECELNRMENK